MVFLQNIIMLFLLLIVVVTAIVIEHYLNCRRTRHRNNTVKEEIMERESLNMSASNINPEEF